MQPHRTPTPNQVLRYWLPYTESAASRVPALTMACLGLEALAAREGMTLLGEPWLTEAREDGQLYMQACRPTADLIPLSLWITPETRAALEQRAQAAGISLPHLLRRAVQAVVGRGIL